MKKIIAIVTLCLLGTLFNIKAQVCTPDTNQTFTSNYPKVWNSGCVGVPYEEFVYFAFPKDTTVVVNITFNSFEILTQNLPAGLTYDCNVASCKWTPLNTTLGPDHILGCMRVHGIPTVPFNGTVTFGIEGCGQTFLGVQCQSDPQSFDLKIYTPSTPAFTYSLVGNTVTFTNTTVHGTSPGFSFNWDFGDGSNSSLENPSHTFSGPGNYNVCMTLTNSCGDSTYCENVMIVGIDPGAIFADWEVYPNPAKDRLSLSGSLESVSNLELSLTSITGKKVLSQAFPSSIGYFQTELDLQSVAPGLYFVEMKTDQGRAVRKIVVR